MTTQQKTSDERKADKDETAASAGKGAVHPTGQVDDNQDDLGRGVNSRSDTSNPVDTAPPARRR